MDDKKLGKLKQEYEKASSDYQKSADRQKRENNKERQQRKEVSLKYISVSAYLFVLILLSFVVGHFQFINRQESFYFNFDIFKVGDYSHSIDNTLFIDDIPLGSFGFGGDVLLGGGSSYLQPQENYEFTFLVKGSFTGTISILFSYNFETRVNLKQDDFLGVSYSYLATGDEPNLVYFEFYAAPSPDFSTNDLSISINTVRTTQYYELENGQYFISGFKNFYDFLIGIFQPLTQLNTTSVFAFLESFFILIWNSIKGVIGL